MKRFLIWGLPAALLAALIVWRFATKLSANAGMKRTAFANRTVSVELATAGARRIVHSIESVGDIESPYKQEIAPKSNGLIEFLEAREGDKVTPGEVLVKIDPSSLEGNLVQQRANVAQAMYRLAQAKLTQGSTDVGVQEQVRQQQANVSSTDANYKQTAENYEAQVAAAQAQLTAAKSAVANAQAGLEKEVASYQSAQTKFNRMSELYKQGFVATQDVDDARTTRDVESGAVKVAQSQLDAAKAQEQVQQQNLEIVRRKGKADIAASRASLDVAKSALQMASANRSQSSAYQQNLDALQAQVEAAQAGVAQAEAMLNDTVLRSTIAGTVTARRADPGGLASPGSPVLEVQYLDWVYVTASAPIEDADQVHEGEIARIEIEGLNGKTFSGPIVHVNPAADPQSRQFTLKVKLGNKGHAVRPGMYARVTIPVRVVDAAVVVPREAVDLAPDGSATVTVVDEDNVAHIRAVKLGVSDDKGYQILDGVKRGEKVVVLAYGAIKDGQQVAGGQYDGDFGERPKSMKSGESR